MKLIFILSLLLSTNSLAQVGLTPSKDGIHAQPKGGSGFIINEPEIFEGDTNSGLGFGSGCSGFLGIKLVRMGKVVTGSIRFNVTKDTASGTCSTGVIFPERFRPKLDFLMVVYRSINSVDANRVGTMYIRSNGVINIWASAEQANFTIGGTGSTGNNVSGDGDWVGFSYVLDRD